MTVAGREDGELAHVMVPPASRGTFPWEFGFIVDQNLRETGVAVVRGRLQLPEHLALLEGLARDHVVMGMTCQGIFPLVGDLPGCLPDDGGPKAGRHDAYLSFVQGWAHCFREPDHYLPRDGARILFSNSDNMDPDRVWRVATSAGPLQKRWDFIYTCMPEPTNFARKNWALARHCALRFADELGLRGALVGLAGVADAPEHPLIDLYPKLPWREFLRVLGQSRVAFLPNTWDPSPRVMAEAMCLDVPMLVNREILGGWHYVSAESGRWFGDHDDVVEAMAGLMSHELAPREWYTAHYGSSHAGPRLARFVTTLAQQQGRDIDVEDARFYSPRDYRGVLPKKAEPKPSHRSAAVPRQDVLDPAWHRWLAMNSLLGVEDAALLRILESHGIAPSLGRSVLEELPQQPLYTVADELGRRLRKLESVMAVSRALSSLSTLADELECRGVPSRNEFIETYFAQNRPVAFDDLTVRWAARGWTPERLRQACGAQNSEQSESQALYLAAGSPFFQTDAAVSLLDDIQPLPDFLDPTDLGGGVSLRVTPPHEATPLRHEVVNLLFVQLFGSERHVLISPDQTPLVYNDVGEQSEVDVDDPDLERHPLFEGVRAFAFLLGPGDALFLPVGWWHQRRSLDEGISMALSNFVVPNSYEYFSPSITVDGLAPPGLSAGGRPERRRHMVVPVDEAARSAAWSYLRSGGGYGAVPSRAKPGRHR